MTEVLQSVETGFRRQTVFISGSADTYGGWNFDSAQAWINKLGHDLINRDLRIASGFGLGVGPALVTGSIQAIYSRNDRTVDANLVMRPFPIGIQDAIERQRTFARYRSELLQQSGIAVFLFGNKLDGTNTVNASGVRDEFEEALKQGLIPIPVGATGFVAEELWHEVRKAPDKYYRSPDKAAPLLDRVGPGTAPEATFSALQEFITLAVRQEI